MGKPIHIVVLWLTVLCSVVDGYQHFERTHLGKWRQHVPEMFILTYQTAHSHIPQHHEYRITCKIQDHKFTKLPHAFQNMKMVWNKIYGHNYNLQLQRLSGWLAAPQYGIFLRKPIHKQLSKFYILLNPQCHTLMVCIHYSETQYAEHQITE